MFDMEYLALFMKNMYQQCVDFFAERFWIHSDKYEKWRSKYSEYFFIYARPNHLVAASQRPC